jgi:hypothetical protein
MKILTLLVRPFYDNFEPRFLFKLCSSLLGGVKGMEIVLLFSQVHSVNLQWPLIAGDIFLYGTILQPATR